MAKRESWKQFGVSYKCPGTSDSGEGWGLTVYRVTDRLICQLFWGMELREFSILLCVGGGFKAYLTFINVGV